MFLILNGEKRIILFANKATPILGGVKIDSNQYISGKDLSVVSVPSVPSHVRAGYYFYKDGEFIADPDRVDADTLNKISHKVEALDVQINDKPIVDMTLDEYKSLYDYVDYFEIFDEKNQNDPINKINKTLDKTTSSTGAKVGRPKLDDDKIENDNTESSRDGGENDSANK